ncbi:MAG: hypothetical protein KC503_38720 [Myxococcales bacterium]|nr:hypothetical protein [Myxococcales bacterium]
MAIRRHRLLDLLLLLAAALWLLAGLAHADGRRGRARRRPVTVIYHGAGCTDGYTSRYVAERFFRSSASGRRAQARGDVRYIASTYGDAPPKNLSGHDVYVVDFSFPRDQLLSLSKIAHSLTVLDHHKSAKERLEGLPFCTFDMKKAGARLTWERFFGNKPAPGLVAYAEDYDLWRFALPSSKEINAAIASYPKSFENFRHLDRRLRRAPQHAPSKSLVQEGAAILAERKKLVAAAVSGAVEVELAGHRVLAANVNGKEISNDTAHALAKGRAFSVMWLQEPDGRIKLSLRSEKDGGADVSAIAKAFPGGGGHPNAAGFTTDGLPFAVLSGGKAPTAPSKAAIARIRRPPALSRKLAKHARAAIKRERARLVEQVARGAYARVEGNKRGLVVNASAMTDAVARRLARSEGVDFALVWTALPGGQFLYTRCENGRVSAEIKGQPPAGPAPQK